ncbi:hypothetical protein HaLaN_24529 [Haematococcus lacustris]|uniref:Uncharacterized protein n=1 Tax=Haematococcus lacustris TaxID=44745 RepID=A0A6A0A2K1_HAELA|nr:hypothetical protein HaLaN_24529 [Haematococcus lacustris]
MGRPAGAVLLARPGSPASQGKEYPELGYKRLQDQPPKAEQQQPAAAQSCQLYTVVLAVRQWCRW